MNHAHCHQGVYPEHKNLHVSDKSITRLRLHNTQQKSPARNEQGITPKLSGFFTNNF
ncbi:hypothetical protein GCM10007275_10720 [Jeotgalicoccus coquinae]|nr:hypothetical protein GCM10007275_10720 [Jeotgalicoccus coquinae]